MNVTIIIFSYQRQKMLADCLMQFGEMLEWPDYEFWVLDDGSDYDPEPFEKLDNVNYIRLPHTGKKGFYLKWADAFEICRQSDSDIYLFMPDDFLNLDMERVEQIHEAIRTPYAFNLYNCGRDICWTGTRSLKCNVAGHPSKQVGFVDCGFFCNREAIQALEFKMTPTPDWWHDRPDKSSGVGWQLSRRFKAAGVKMYRPIKNIADHGEDGKHDSVMHPEGNFVRNGRINKAYCINLDDRPKKWNRFIAQELPFEVERFPGIKRSPGWMGCRDTHLKIFEKMQGTTVVMEDDCKMIKSWDFVIKCVSQLPSDWDALWLGSTLNEPLEQYSDNLYKLHAGGWTTHAIIYNGRRIADFVIERRRQVGKIDVFLADHVQPRFNCYITYPMAATQRPGYSDVINRETDYSLIEEHYKNNTR